MNRNDCEAVLHLHRTFLPRRRTGRGFLTGIVFLDAALLIAAFVLALSPFVLKPGISIDLPSAANTDSISQIHPTLRITSDGTIFFDDRMFELPGIAQALKVRVQQTGDSILILETDQTVPQAMLTAVYDAAAQAGFQKVFIATQSGL